MTDLLDTNHFRYCGEYLDAETGRYYLRARYYDPLIGRFTQRDTHWNTANMIYGDNPQKINEREDKLGLKTYSYAPQITAIMQAGNLYVYGINNPVAYFDRTGSVVETVLDVISLLVSIADVAANPTNVWAWVGLAGDIVDLIPFVTCVGESVKAIRITYKLTDTATDAVKSSDRLISSYKTLKKMTKGQGVEVHHLVEKRFAKTLGIDDTDGILSVVLNKGDHQEITNSFRKYIGYARDKKDYITSNATADRIWFAIVKTYEENGMKDLIPLIKEYLLNNAKYVNKISDWQGY